MSRFPGLEAKILKTLEEEGEMRSPAGRIGQEYFWQAAARLQAKGLAVADQQAGVVRKVVVESLEPLRLTIGGKQTESLVPVTATPSAEGLLEGPRPVDDLRSRCALLVQRWRQAGGERGRCAVDLEEVLEEMGLPA